MDIYEVLKLMSSATKAHIVAHFWDCHCKNEHCVSDLQDLLGVNQSNLSKHIARLLALGVLDYGRENKQRFYKISPVFREKWDTVLTPIVKNVENHPFECPKCVG